MSKRSLAMMFLAGVVLATWGAVYSSGGMGPNVAQAADAQVSRVINEASSWEYGILEITGVNGYKFTYGDEILGRNGSSIGNLMTLFDGRLNGNPTFANLLNVIGNKGWELIHHHDDGKTETWLFKRTF